MPEPTDAELARSFDTLAERYERARPSYPDALFDDLLAWLDTDPPARVLDIGAGTGLATRGFVDRGCTVTAVEPGANLAAVLRGNVPAATVVSSTFEDAELPDAAFDLVVAAQAWHWVDPDRAIPQAARVLRPGGAIALWWVWQAAEYFGPLGPQLAAAFDAVFGLDPARGADTARPPRVAELAATGVFGAVEEREYTIHRTYTTEQYLDLVSTWSMVALLDEAERAALLAALAAIVDADGGVLDAHLPVHVYRARLGAPAD